MTRRVLSYWVRHFEQGFDQRETLFASPHAAFAYARHVIACKEAEVLEISRYRNTCGVHFLAEVEIRVRYPIRDGHLERTIRIDFMADAVEVPEPVA